MTHHSTNAYLKMSYLHYKKNQQQNQNVVVFVWLSILYKILLDLIYC